VSEVTLGHLAASFRAEAVVTRRQLFPPNPSVSPSEIFFGPHHEGAFAVFAAFEVFEVFEVFADEVVAVSMTTPLMSAKTRSAPPLLLFIVRALPFISVNFKT
jgi:hypothetical protein